MGKDNIAENRIHRKRVTPVIVDLNEEQLLELIRRKREALMLERNWPEPVTNDELTCLNTWPPGTIGHEEDKKMIEALNVLCVKHGYGMVLHIAQQLRQLWYEPSAMKTFQAEQKARQERLKEYI